MAKPITLNLLIVTALLSLGSGFQAAAMSCKKLTGVAIQSQIVITSKIKEKTPPLLNFIKDVPILGYRITSDKFTDLPEAI